jgi:hypothetical protein
VLRDVVIHLLNEQPLRGDLERAPGEGDVVLICRNLRTMNGKKPVFVDHADSTFLFPMAHVRFVEITRAAVEEAGGASEAEPAEEAGEGEAGPVQPAPRPDVPLTSEIRAMLDRLNAIADGRFVETPADFATGEPVSLPEGLDPELLRRIREA